jgi:hypothetical protein
MCDMLNQADILPPVRRWKIYTGERGRDFLCIVAARTRDAAMKTARSMFQLTRKAYAVQETRSEMEFAARRLSCQTTNQ